MASSEILTFSAPQVQAAQVEAMPSPTLELAYAYYFLNRKDSAQRVGELPWLAVLYGKHKSLVESIKTFWPEDGRGGEFKGDILLVAVCALGYARDADTKRLLEEFGGLPGRVVEYLEWARSETLAYLDRHGKDSHRKDYQGMIECFLMLGEPERGRRFLSSLKRLWKVLEPMWNEEGRAQAERASREFMAKYRETGDVLRALPTHHFTQFEGDSQAIRKSLENNKLLAVPLFFASSGGFNFDFTGAHYIGYGIQSERFFETLSARVGAAAGRIKAVADPTRLMLLTLIARYDGFDMTVSDFASQLGVTQPTVSGHLKLLKEADLVTLEKRGNKAIYKLNTPALEEAIGEFQALILKK